MITALGKAINKIFNRLTITVALILVQLGWFAVLLFKLADYASWISVLFTVLAALMALFVIWRDVNPAYKMGWILLICLMPILGAAMYAFFGNKRPAKSLKWRIDPQEALHKDDLKQEEDLGEIMNTRLLDTVNYIAQKGPYPAWTDTKSKYYAVGDEVYPDILADLKKAEHFIFMEYFIIAEGKMWDGIFAILKEKAAAGVDVRITFDDVGSINKTPKRFISSLAQHGIKVLPFNPLTPIASLIYNNRDHRKILVIDGYIGYSGGFNIADEYINEVVRFGHWKDTGIRLEGHAVWNFTVMFLIMWNAFKKTEED